VHAMATTVRGGWGHDAGRRGATDGGRVRCTHVGEGELKKAVGLEKARGGWRRLEKASVVVDAPAGARGSGRWGASRAASGTRDNRLLRMSE
jgi:hypothetical protein